MSSIIQSGQISLKPHSNERVANLCGPSNENIRSIEQHFAVSINPYADGFNIRGDSPRAIEQVKNILQKLYVVADTFIKPELIDTYMKEPDSSNYHHIRLRKKNIKTRNYKQHSYLDAIEKNDMVFALGPAGTGKTYLAVAKAVEQLEKGLIQRLVFVRPAVEAGEKLGFLPGDLVDKVLPYLRPIYDALYEFLGFNETQKLLKNDVIEILPLAFMRGRTLNEAFIILDEAQNTTHMQMKMFLTRFGFGSKVVITGDTSQVDLPKGTESGLNHAVKLLAGTPDISINRFTSKEVVRHPLVSKIIDAYEKKQG